MKKKLIIFLLILILIAANLGIVYIFFGHPGKAVVNSQLVVAKDDNTNSANGGNNNSTVTPPENNNPAAEALPQDNNTSGSSTAGAADNNTAAGNTPAGSNQPPTLNKTTAPASTTLSIANRLVSWGFARATNRVIDTIIIHTSYDATGADPFSLSGTIAEYKATAVSPHYIIDRSGNVYRLVEDANIAYHAGVAKMPDGRTNVNSFSLGIEVINTKTNKPTDAQYNALKNLIAYLKGKYKIKYVLGHSQIAPVRKDDPWNFDWSRIK